MENCTKDIGQVFTPTYLVNLILDCAGYSGQAILKRHVMDNSCGDGAFLSSIVERYVDVFLQRFGNLRELCDDLKCYIHGIEKDFATHRKCLEKLNAVTRKRNLPDIEWDVVCGDALLEKRFFRKMDFVVGNPPYVRVHNLKDEYSAVKNFSFAQGGMTDLFLVFFEIGFEMLNETGKLCYITPSSWINSLAGKNLRQNIFERKNLCKIIDLEHFQAFAATTYTMISLFDNRNCERRFSYNRFCPETRKEEFIDFLNYEDCFIDGNIYLAHPQVLKKIRNIKTGYQSSKAKVKNGFATLADDVFIRRGFPFSNYTIPILKASTGKWYQAFFPYDHNGKPVSREDIFKNQTVRDYLDTNKQKLLKNHTPQENPFWYLFGRTQALKDVYKNKFAINSLVKDKESIKLSRVPSGSGVYSGLYILTELPEEKLKEIIVSDDFIEYVSSLKKYKNGGYYTFNSGDLENYINAAVMTEQNLFEFDR